MHQRRKGELDHLPFVVLQLEYFSGRKVMGRGLTVQQQAIIHIADHNGHVTKGTGFLAVQDDFRWLETFFSKASISRSRSQLPPMWTKKHLSSHTERMAAVSACSRPFQNI